MNHSYVSSCRFFHQLSYPPISQSSPAQELIAQALEGTVHECCASFPQKKTQPEVPMDIHPEYIWKSNGFLRKTRDIFMEYRVGIASLANLLGMLGYGKSQLRVNQTPWAKQNTVFLGLPEGNQDDYIYIYIDWWYIDDNPVDLPDFRG